MKKNRQNPSSVPEGATGEAGTARDREMGRAGGPLGDRGRGNETWTPPQGEQGISNRPDDDEVEPVEADSTAGDEDAEFEDDLDDEFEEADGFDDEDEDNNGR
jgi:hypothetical protein